MSADVVELDLGLGGEGRDGLVAVAESLGWDPNELATAIINETMRRVAGRVVYRLAVPAEAEGNVIPFRRPRLRLPAP